MKFTRIFFLNIFLKAIILISVLMNMACSRGQNSTSEKDKNQIPHKLFLQTTLAEDISETSGLSYSEGHLFTHNDSGDENKLYVVSENDGEILNTITLSGAEHIDYEDICDSEKYLYIGDFGNNKGMRKDLCVYLINKKDLCYDEKNMTVKVEKISFVYPSQKDFEKSKDHNFDCEAMVYYKDTLYLFSKNRKDNRTDLYALSATPGDHSVRHISSFNSDGLITGAALRNDGKVLALTGYKKEGDSFLWVFSDYIGIDFFNGKSVRHILGSNKTAGQTEGVCFKNQNTLYISAEKAQDKQARLYRFKL